jgi:hypothetical protein
VRSQARLEVAERAAQRVEANRAARLARRPITSADEAIELLVAVKGEGDWDDRKRAITARMTEEAKTALRGRIEQELIDRGEAPPGRR